MERIIEHIERLLLQHDCVIIPDFGGFVLQSIPAEYLEESDFFKPMRKEIVFNPTLTHNDGLLTESYMQYYAFNFSNALSLIRDDVAEIKKQLDDNIRLRLGSIGLFFKDADRLVFVPDKHGDKMFGIHSFGLPFFNFLPLTARNVLDVSSFTTTISENKAEKEPIIEKNAKQGKNVIYTIPVTGTFLQIVGAAAAAILLLLILPTPISDVNNTSYSASFVPQEIIPKKSTNEIVSDDFSIHADDDKNHVSESGVSVGSVSSEADNSILSSNSSTPASNPVTSTTTKNRHSSETTLLKSDANANTKTNTKANNETASKSTKTNTKATQTTANSLKYYVIIASYDTRTRAQTHINQLNSNEKANAGIVVKDGHVRVYARYFPTKNEAETFTAQLRRNPKHANAWVYKGQ